MRTCLYLKFQLRIRLQLVYDIQRENVLTYKSALNFQYYHNITNMYDPIYHSIKINDCYLKLTNSSHDVLPSFTSFDFSILQ